MKIVHNIKSWLIWTFIAMTGLTLLLIASASFIKGSNLLALMIALTLTYILFITTAVLVFAEHFLKTPKETRLIENNKWLLEKIMASLAVLSLIISAYSAIHSLGFGDVRAKFVFNNTANGAIIAALAFIGILSLLQRNMYGISLNKGVKLDERQKQKRQAVFEKSYKIGTTIAIIAVIYLYSSKSNLPAIINNPITFNVTPGALFLPLANVVLLLYALPMLVAAFDNHKLGLTKAK